MWCRVSGWLVPDVSKQCSGLIFKVECPRRMEFHYWIWGYYLALKNSVSITQWLGATSQKNVDFLTLLLVNVTAPFAPRCVCIHKNIVCQTKTWRVWHPRSSKFSNNGTEQKRSQNCCRNSISFWLNPIFIPWNMCGLYFQIVMIPMSELSDIQNIAVFLKHLCVFILRHITWQDLWFLQRCWWSVQPSERFEVQSCV
jgi:hypothetical protein